MLEGEARALGELAGKAVSGPAGIARGVHEATAGRIFGALGVVGKPVRIAHDGISTLAYGAVTSALRTPAARGAAVLARARPGGIRLADTPAGALALGALNGAFGDSIASQHPDIAVELELRRRGMNVAPDSEGLAAAYPDATPRIAVFVHGLCETEDAWRLLPLTRREPARRTYGARLRDELGYTPVYVRYNSGLHVSDNGKRLSEVLDHAVRAWPVPVEEVALIGHSMGGLVARSACHYGERDGHAWTEPLRHVFCLGTPHLGAPLERAANVAGHALTRLPETRPFARLVNGRSVGIKDMRFGNCVEEDWCDCDPDEYLRDRCREVPFLPTAAYYFIGATLSRDPESRLASLVGDLLVQFPSASGNGPRRRLPFEIDKGRHLGGLNHFQLLNHPAVYELIRAWLEPRALAEASAG